MATTNLADVPYFFKGTYDNLQTALAPGGIYGTLTKVGIAYITDRKCLAYVQKDGTITLIGDASSTVVPESGTVAEPVVLDTLPAGVYSIKGTYQTTSTETPISSSANQLFIIGDDGTITHLSGDGITKQVVTSTGTVVQEAYVTDGEISRAIASTDDIKDLFK